MNHLKIGAALLPQAFAFGCATTQSLSDADRKAIRSVSIANTIPLPPQPVVVGKATQTGSFWGGPLVMAVMMSTENSDGVAFKRHLEAHKIDIGQIVRDEFITELKAGNASPAVVSEGGDASFDLTIESYGLGPGFSMSPTNKPLRPTLVLVAKLTRDGKVSWQNSASITGISGEVPSLPIDEYYKDATRIQDAFKKAARVVVKDLLKDFRGN